MNTLPDDIAMFLGAIPEDEYEMSKSIRTCRNAATYKAHKTASDNARDLCWHVCDCATFWIYRPAPVETLRLAAQFMMGLLKSADRAETLEGLA